MGCQGPRGVCITRSFTIVLHMKCYSADEIKKYEMVEACGTYGEGGSAYRVLVGKAEGETV